MGFRLSFSVSCFPLALAVVSCRLGVGCGCRLLFGCPAVGAAGVLLGVACCRLYGGGLPCGAAETGCVVGVGVASLLAVAVVWLWLAVVVCCWVGLLVLSCCGAVGVCAGGAAAGVRPSWAAVGASVLVVVVGLGLFLWCLWWSSSGCVVVGLCWSAYCRAVGRRAAVGRACGGAAGFLCWWCFGGCFASAGAVGGGGSGAGAVDRFPCGAGRACAGVRWSAGCRWCFGAAVLLAVCCLAVVFPLQERKGK